MHLENWAHFVIYYSMMLKVIIYGFINESFHMNWKFFLSWSTPNLWFNIIFWEINPERVKSEKSPFSSIFLLLNSVWSVFQFQTFIYCVVFLVGGVWYGEGVIFSIDIRWESRKYDLFTFSFWKPSASLVFHSKH